MIRAVEASGLTRPLSTYSHAIQAGDYLFVSGLGPLDENAGLIGTTVEDQTAATLENLNRVMGAAGGSLSKVVRVTVYLGSIESYDRFNRVYEKYFAAPPYPARTCIGANLWHGVMIEMDAVAYLPGVSGGGG